MFHVILLLFSDSFAPGRQRKPNSCFLRKLQVLMGYVRSDKAAPERTLSELWRKTVARRSWMSEPIGRNVE